MNNQASQALSLYRYTPSPPSQASGMSGMGTTLEMLTTRQAIFGHYKYIGDKPYHEGPVATAKLSLVFLRQSLIDVSLVGKTSIEKIDTVKGLSRLRLLWKTDTIGAGSISAGIIGLLYLIFRGVYFIAPIFISWILAVAHAQSSASPHEISSNLGRDSFDWLIAGLMGAVLLAAVGAALFSTEQKKITFGMDMTKSIVGFLIGFLSGGKGRI